MCSALKYSHAPGLRITIAPRGSLAFGYLAVDELSGQRLPTKKRYAGSGRVCDEHDQRSGRGEKEAVEQSEKQHAEECEQGDSKFARRREPQPSQIVDFTRCDAAISTMAARTGSGRL